jgi:GTPase SAR1 family protein
MRQIAFDLSLFYLQENKKQPLVDAVVVVFSVIDASSFQYGTKRIEMIRHKMKYGSPIFLVGNKCDLARNRMVSEKGNNISTSLAK